MKSKSMPIGFLVLFTFVFFAPMAGAQTWNSNAGGYNTGYGTVYGSFGLAQATQNMYNTMQMNMQRSIMRQAMIKKWGKAAVEKAEANARSGRSSANSNGSSGPAITSAPPIPKNYGLFRPDATVNTGKIIADTLGETAEEKQLYLKIYTDTKTAFETQTSAKGWKNNIAGAFTFFIVSTGTIYQGSEEPSDDSVDALYNAINQSLDEIPEFGSMANRDKQALYNTLIAFAGIPIATYLEGVGNKDAATIAVAKQLSGALIKIVLKIEPDRIKISNGQITIS